MGAMADRIEYEVRDGIAWLRMDDGKVNAMDSDFCDRMQAVLDEATGDASRALIITGRSGYFSAGLNFKLLAGLAGEEVRRITNHFMETMKRVFLFPKPVIAAASGHAVAGGMMLFLAADIRLAIREGQFRYGLNEALTGVPFLGGTLGICHYGIPAAHHTELILQGRMLDAEGCLLRGVAHELVTSERLLDRARERARELDDLALEVYGVNKLLLRQETYEKAVETARALASLAPRRNVFDSM